MTVPDWGGKGKAKVGYFVPMRFNIAPSKFYTEKHPEGKEGDVDLLMLLGEDAPTAKWLEAEMEDGSRVRYTFDIAAGEDKTLVNKLNATKWGFAKTATELDGIVGPGESSYIDHDGDVFYYVLKDRISEGGKKYVNVIKLDGKLYACFHNESFQYSYSGMGANRGAGHPTDYDWVSSDGQTWTQDKTSKEVSGKTVTMEVWKFAEDVDDANAQTALKGSHEVVFGPQEIVCDQTRSYNAVEAASYAAMTKAQLMAEAKSKGIAIPKGATKAQIREALEG